jgi:hypothetical protein
VNPTSRMARRALAVAALTCAAALAAGCSSSSTPATAPTVRSTVTAPATPTQNQNTQNPAPAASPTTAAPPAGPPPCTTGDLKVSLGASQGTAGSTYIAIDFTNSSSSSCTLYGYPGISLTGGTPVAQIGKTAKEDPLTPRQLVTLPPGTTGNALLKIADAGNYPASTCGPANTKYLRIYPPNQTASVQLPFKTQTCTKPVRTMLIDVVKPGPGS